jgi:HPt (histidine-containing phosphotransfer) domain-containing protein
VSALDRPTVHALLEALGRDAFVDLVEEYVDDSARLVGEIGECAAAGDLARVRRAAHELKSTARLIGALGLADICADLEGTVSEKGADSSSLDEAVTLAVELCESANEELRVELARTRRG